MTIMLQTTVIVSSSGVCRTSAITVRTGSQSDGELTRHQKGNRRGEVSALPNFAPHPHFHFELGIPVHILVTCPYVSWTDLL